VKISAGKRGCGKKREEGEKKRAGGREAGMEGLDI
jgi:hypothetical protein